MGYGTNEASASKGSSGYGLVMHSLFYLYHLIATATLVIVRKVRVPFLLKKKIASLEQVLSKMLTRPVFDWTASNHVSDGVPATRFLGK